MKKCPVCNNESKSVGPKPLWDTKQRGNVRGGDMYRQVIMCDECNLRYKRGELKFEGK